MKEKILAIITKHNSASGCGSAAIIRGLGCKSLPERTAAGKILAELLAEGAICRSGNVYLLPDSKLLQNAGAGPLPGSARLADDLVAACSRQLGGLIDSGVVDRDELSQLASVSRTLDGLKRRLVEKKLAYVKGLKPASSGEQVTFPVKLRFPGSSHTVACLPVHWHKLLIASVDTSGREIESLRSAAQEETQKHYDGYYQALVATGPGWLNPLRAAGWIVRHIHRLPQLSESEIRLDLATAHLRGLDKAGCRELGLIGASAKTLLVQLSYDIFGSPIQITSQMPIEPAAAALANGWLSRPAADLIADAIAAYADLCRGTIAYLLERTTQSKSYGEAVAALGDAAPALYRELLAEQLQRFGRHDSIDLRLLHASVSRSLSLALSDKLASSQAALCHAELPPRLCDFYPVARRLKRKLTYISGPTNSGKTFQALQRLTASGSGVYLGPLRLLALEVRDTLTEGGHPTSLVTGELVEFVPGAKYTAATIEMLDYELVHDVAIIDEAHMLADRQRGSAWLQAIIGAPAREVIILGAPEALAAVTHLAEYLGEELTVITTERLTPLELDAKATNISDIGPGSAIVVFSRREALGLAAELKSRHKRKVALIYGALSPAVRKEQARLFRSGEAEILVATDAIGMGLNLPIRSIYFSASSKFNGVKSAPVEHDLVWQIAGRAGRFGQHESGTVGALNRDVLKYVKRVMEKRPEPISNVFQFEPSLPIIELIAKHLQTNSLEKIFLFFSQSLQLSHAGITLRSHVDDDRLAIARFIDRHELPLENKARLACVPVPYHKGQPDKLLKFFLKKLQHREPVLLASLPELAPAGCRTLESAEHAVKLLTMYAWLHYRFDRFFPDIDAAQEAIEQLDSCIVAELSKAHIRRCDDCGRKLPWDHSFNSCESCFSSRRSW